MRRIVVVLMMIAVVVAMAATAGPALAQLDDKAAKRAAKQAEKKAAKKAAKQAQKAQNPAPPANTGGQQKALPASGGPVVDLGLLGAGVLLVGGGLVAVRVVRR